MIIEDDGIGIPNDLLYQMSKGESPNVGIGIPNIRKRLDSIPGATLTFSSEMGRGTRVTMYLPTGLNGLIP
ncbi:Histidine kinase-, DNA gyrase B-, and HSP90-like ATPase [compost metagenome]